MFVQYWHFVNRNGQALPNAGDTMINRKREWIAANLNP